MGARSARLAAVWIRSAALSSWLRALIDFHLEIECEECIGLKLLEVVNKILCLGQVLIVARPCDFEASCSQTGPGIRTMAEGLQVSSALRSQIQVTIAVSRALGQSPFISSSASQQETILGVGEVLTRPPIPGS